MTSPSASTLRARRLDGEDREARKRRLAAERQARRRATARDEAHPFAGVMQDELVRTLVAHGLLDPDDLDSPQDLGSAALAILYRLVGCLDEQRDVERDRR